MKRLFLVGCAGLLASCSAIGQDNTTACVQALIAANTISPSKLFSVAVSTPACIALGEQAIQALINDVAAKQAARGVRQ